MDKEAIDILKIEFFLELDDFEYLNEVSYEIPENKSRTSYERKAELKSEMTKLEYLIKRFSEKGQNPENNKLVLCIQNRINEIIHKLIVMSKLDFDYSKCDDNPFMSLSNVESPSKQPNSGPVVYRNTKAIKRKKKKGNKVKSVYRIKSSLFESYSSHSEKGDYGLLDS
ncbi:MAG: hypothetical protein J5875_05125 [Paludibacteraceae bacterium]|nr:hypothetical protein [Paludibacteraceae bacterium]